MNNIEAKIKELGLLSKIGHRKIPARYPYFISINKDFETEEAAYNWVAKKFNLERLVSKDEVIKWFYEHSYGIEEERIFDINDFVKWLEDK